MTRSFCRLALTFVLSWFASLACRPKASPPDPEDSAQRMVATLRAVPGEKERAAISAFTLNTLCSISRMASGQAEGRVEEAVATLLADKPEEIKNLLVTYRETLEHIPSSTRSELLGDLDSFDPGLCEAAPEWDRLRDGIIFNHQLIPHLRFNFCSNNFTYGDGTSGERAITTGSLLTAIEPPTDGTGPGTPLFASFATPALIGVEQSDFVVARHPGLAATADDGEGISLYGFKTNIPCSSTNNSCDASLGLICSSNTCVAYPVVQKDQTIVLRGYNFWDVTEARLVFEPLLPGQGSESTTIISTLDPNEPTDPAAACTLPSITNASYNRAHFRVPANEGHFYRLRMYNHNGQFLTQQDGADDGAGRVIHTCFPPAGPHLDNVPPGTIRDCTFPQETCVQDGATCAATWTTPPRELEECGHLPGQPSPCGETPEWYEAQMLSPRADGIATSPDKAIVFVEAEAPVFELSATLHAMESIEESGVDFPGSDEPMMAIVGTALGAQPVEVPDIEKLTRRFVGQNYDEGDRDIPDFKLVTTDLPIDSEAVYLALLVENDGFLEPFVAGIVAIALATAIIWKLAGPSTIAALGGATGVLLVWTIVVEKYIAPNDTMGIESISATPLQVQERIGKTHAPDFLTIQPPPADPLPEVPDSRREGVARKHVIHPFIDNRATEDFLQPECDPGACPSGEQCRVNRCVEVGFVDPTDGVGFRERRRYNGTGDYAVELLWELRKK
jgi:hypothetical protein